MSEIPPVPEMHKLREVLYAAVVADALDSLGFRNQSPRVQFSIQTASTVLIGRCRTTLWTDLFHSDPNPYELELKAVDACEPDDVLICAAGGSMQSGIWGELLTTAARNRGCVGAIVDGAVRDTRQIRTMGFPVFARNTCVLDSQDRQCVIDMDVRVEIDGVGIEPGDLVVADCDGVVIVPAAVEAETLSAAWKKVHAENVTRDAIRGGMKATDAYARFGVL